MHFGKASEAAAAAVVAAVMKNWACSRKPDLTHCIHNAVCCCMQVWENTPGFGEAPFLDTLWSSIDEVGGLQRIFAAVAPWLTNTQTAALTGHVDVSEPLPSSSPWCEYAAADPPCLFLLLPLLLLLLSGN